MPYFKKLNYKHISIRHY